LQVGIDALGNPGCRFPMRRRQHVNCDVSGGDSHRGAAATSLVVVPGTLVGNRWFTGNEAVIAGEAVGSDA
jgi:hypothetical protein